mmetsp:Transcript_2982/g.8404  ORF Transcript_2982/g.8404 Transcript_2982/m.8404 type:complete len:261 (-) Transcript_2982:2468-3250(-)
MRPQQGQRETEPWETVHAAATVSLRTALIVPSAASLPWMRAQHRDCTQRPIAWVPCSPLADSFRRAPKTLPTLLALVPWPIPSMAASRPPAEGAIHEEQPSREETPARRRESRGTRRPPRPASTSCAARVHHPVSSSNDLHLSSMSCEPAVSLAAVAQYSIRPAASCSFARPQSICSSRGLLEGALERHTAWNCASASVCWAGSAAGGEREVRARPPSPERKRHSHMPPSVGSPETRWLWLDSKVRRERSRVCGERAAAH